MIRTFNSRFGLPEKGFQRGWNSGPLRIAEILLGTCSALALKTSAVWSVVSGDLPDRTAASAQLHALDEYHSLPMACSVAMSTSPDTTRRKARSFVRWLSRSSRLRRWSAYLAILNWVTAWSTPATL